MMHEDDIFSARSQMFDYGVFKVLIPFEIEDTFKQWADEVGLEINVGYEITSFIPQSTIRFVDWLCINGYVEDLDAKRMTLGIDGEVCFCE